MSHHQSAKTKRVIQSKGEFNLALALAQRTILFKTKSWSKFILILHLGWKCISNILKRVILSRHFIWLIKLFYTLDFILKSNTKYEIWILFRQNSKHAPIRTGHYSNWISMIFPPIFTIICLVDPFLFEHVWWNSNLIDVFVTWTYIVRIHCDDSKAGTLLGIYLPP